MTTYNAGEASLAIVPDAREFKAKLEADLKRVNAEYAVQITADLARARADLDKFRAEQEAKAIHLRAEVDRSHLKSSFDALKGDFENLGSTLGKALKIDAATAGIELLPSLATGLASVAQAMQQVAEAGVAIPGILAGVGASVGTLALGLSGVKDAWSAIEKQSSESGASQARSAQQAIAATNSLRNAKVDEANAQKDVADAYKDARQQLEDLNIEQRGGVLSEREAILEAMKARRDLATGRYKDGLDYQEAQLRVEEADQRVVQARQHNIELQQKVSDANAKGITGSDEVVKANERLVRSQQSVQSAQAALNNQGAGGAADKAAEAMAKLAPNAREFLQTVISLKPTMLDLRNAVQQNLFAGMSQSLKHLADADLPNLKKGLGGVATSLNQDFRQLFASLGSDSTRGLIDRILGNTADADSRMKAAIDPIVHAVGVLTAAGSDSLPRLADALDHIADKFDHFISAAANDGRLKKWIDDGLTAFTNLGEIVLHLGESFNGITKALGGEGLLSSLDRATGKMAIFLNSADGQAKLTRLFKEGRDEFHKWEPVIENIAKMLPPMFQAAKQNADEFLPIIKEITGFLVEHPDLVKEATGAYLLWETTLKPIGAVTHAVLGVSNMVRALITSINLVGPASVEAATAVEGSAAGMGTAIATAIAPWATALATLGVLINSHGSSAPTNIGPGASDRQAKLDAGKKYAEKYGDNHMPKGYAQWLDGKGPMPPEMAPFVPGAPGGPNKNFYKDWYPSSDGPYPGAIPGTPGGPAGPNGKVFGPSRAFAAGGPTPHNSGPLSDGGYHAVIHPSEYVVNSRGRSTVGDSFLAAANQGKIDPSLLPHFDVGGPGDKVADPSRNPANVGPQQIAPSPLAGGGGILNNVLGGIASGAQGPIGNAIGLFNGLAGQGGQGGGGGIPGLGGLGGGIPGLGGGGGGMVPGIWGLAQAGGNPMALQAWGSQTANWTANFAANTLMSAGQTFLGGILGGVGLGGSILSPSNVYNQAATKTAGFFLGDQSPFASMMGGGGGSAPGGIGSQSITLGDGSTVQIPTFGTAQGGGGLPAGMVNSDGTLTPGAQRAIQYAQGHAVGQKYVYGGVGPTGYDCSGIASAIYAAAKGLPQGQRYFTTESDFTSLGFTPGYQPGALNIGVMRGGGGPNSHMVLTLPNGVNVESGGASDTTQYGGSARGAATMPLQFHLTLPGAMPPPGGIPGLPASLYDEGGMLPLGVSLANNQSGKPEAVLTNQQTQAYQAVAQHLASQPTPSTPQVPDAGHLQSPSTTQGPQQPPSTAATPVPSPGGPSPSIPAPTPTGGAISPSLAPPSVAPAPSSTDHNLKAIDTGIDSGAQAIGQAVSTAIGVAGGAAGGFGGGAVGAIGPYVAGLIKEGGTITKDAVNVVSSFLVGNVTGGTQDLAYGSQLRPAQNTPNTAPGVPKSYTFNGMDIPKVFQELDLREAQEHQSALASHPRISA